MTLDNEMLLSFNIFIVVCNLIAANGWSFSIVFFFLFAFFLCDLIGVQSKICAAERKPTKFISSEEQEENGPKKAQQAEKFQPIELKHADGHKTFLFFFYNFIVLKFLQNVENVFEWN